MEDPLGVRRNERETLEGSLDWYRAVVEHKVEDLNLDQARSVLTPTGLSVLGVIKHLGWVERGWFREIFAGEEVGSIDSEEDNSAEFAIDRHDTIESVLGFYRDEIEQSRQIAGGSSLEDLSVKRTRFDEHVSLRWILVHMLEETARHAGHMDVMREKIDGRTGD
jgi:uncharacterized damage-inducible protein DinB